MPSKYILPKTLKVQNKNLYKPTVYKFPTRGVIATFPNDVWSCDLIDMNNKPSGGFRYVLVCVDVYSRKVFYKLLKSKNTDSLIGAFNNIFSKEGVRPIKIWADQESGLLAQDFKKEFSDITVYHTFGKAKSVLAERAIKTMRELVEKVNQHSDGWSSIIGPIVQTYNNTEHSSIHTDPNSAFDGSDLGKARTWNFINYHRKRKEPQKKLEVGDKVRLQVKKGVFMKGFTAKWTNELFIVVEVCKTNPTTYKVKDKKEEVIQGSFYAQELQKI